MQPLEICPHLFCNCPMTSSFGDADRGYLTNGLTVSNNGEIVKLAVELIKEAMYYFSLEPKKLCCSSGSRDEHRRWNYWYQEQSA